MFAISVLCSRTTLHLHFKPSKVSSEQRIHSCRIGQKAAYIPCSLCICGFTSIPDKKSLQQTYSNLYVPQWWKESLVIISRPYFTWNPTTDIKTPLLAKGWSKVELQISHVQDILWGTKNGWAMNDESMQTWHNETRRPRGEQNAYNESLEHDCHLLITNRLKCIYKSQLHVTL